MSFEPIAVTGVSVLFPGSADTAGFWRDVLAGRDLLTDVPSTYWATSDYFDPDPRAPDRTYSRRGGFIPEVPFDPLANGLPPNVLPATDNAQLLSLIVAERVLAEALGNGRFPNVDRDRISVILGATGTTELISHMSGRIERPRWEAALRASGLDEVQVKRLADRIADQFTPWQENTFPGFLGNVIAGRIANRLDLGGTNCVVDAACASSLAAIRMAVHELTTGDSDLVLTGGVDALNVPLMYMAFSKTGALSRSGDCRPYSDQADGTMLGDGVGMMAMRRLADAERDGDRIYAVLRGLGSSSDGRAKSIYAPVAEGQARAVRRAYQSAGFSPATVELVEGHGTGTTAGDKAEVAGLSLAFDDLAPPASDGTTPRRQWCALGSIKSQIGHLKGAAGVAGMFKVVMALHQKVLPPTIKVDRPNPACDVARTPFYLNTRLRPWVRDGRHPRRAGVSAAGFGGTNFHVVLEEYVGPAPKAWKVRPISTELILAAADDAVGLAARCEQLLRECEESGAGADGLQRVARRSQERFAAAGAARLALVASDLEDLKRKLRRAAEAIRKDPGRDRSDPSGTYFAVGKEPGKVAFLFPGQGSQYVGMGQDLALFFDDARTVWDRAADLEFEGVRLHEVVFPPPGFGEEDEAEQRARLTRTEWAQPALAACSMAALAVLRGLGLEPDVVAGHSFGELSALCAAGAFELLDLIGTARRRGELMAVASTVPGAMTAVRASSEQLEQALNGCYANVSVANRNGPRQVVLSGPLAAVEAAEAELTAASLTFNRLPVSTAFHSPLVSPSVEPFRDFLQSTPMQQPRTSVYGNSTAEPYSDDMDEARDVLAHQLACPVQFEEMVQNLARRGVRTFIEVGAGGVLTGLVGECLPGQPHLAVAMDRKKQPGLTGLWHCLGQLAVQGVTLNWNALWQDHPDLPPPKAPPSHAVMVGGSSKGRRPELLPAVASPPPAALAPRDQPALQSTLPLPGTPVPAILARPDLHPDNHVSSIPTPSSTNRNGDTPMPLIKPPAPHTNGTAQLLSIPSGEQGGWQDVLQGILHETAKVQETHQNLMAESLQRYFESVERIIQQSAGGIGRLPVEPVSRFAEPVERAPLAWDRADTPTVMREVPKAWAPPIRQSEVVQAAAELPTTNGKVHMTARPETIASSAAVVGPVAIGVDLEKELVRVVAEKTGYPPDLLALESDMESDLGIDSIKRVEILSALESVAPGMAGADPSEMLAVRTLADVLALLLKTNGKVVPAQTPAAPPVVVSPAPAETAAPTAAPAGGPAFPRLAVRIVDAPALGFALGGLRESSPLALLVSANDDDDAEIELAWALADQLRTYGVEAVVSSEISPGARGVIFLGGLRPIEEADQALRVQREAFQAARAFAQAARTGGVFVMIQDTGGDFGLSGCGVRAWLGGLSGLAKTAASEWPDASVKAIDLEQGGRPPEELAAVILRELLEGGSEVEVGLRADGRRLSLACVPSPLPTGTGSPAVGDGDVIVVSGGARGVTAAALKGLAGVCRPRFVLLGRTPLQPQPACCQGLLAEAELSQALLNEARSADREVTLPEVRAQARQIVQQREIEENLAALRSAGAEVRYLSIDVRDRDSLAANLAKVRLEWGPIRGIIHGAGVLADRLIKDKTVEQLDQVFSVKIDGLRALLAATESDPLRLLCLFSSVAGRFGNPGQSDYSMANEVLNKVANAEARRRGKDCLVKAINWGAWEGGMVTPILKERFEARGVRLLPLEEGGRQFAAELTSGAGEVEVVLGVADLNDPLKASRGAVTGFDVAVGAERMAFLHSHCVEDGVPVVPVVLVLEWFVRAGRAVWPGQDICCRDLKVLAGAPLRDLERGAWFRIHCRRTADSVLEVELHRGRVRHYSAVLTPAPRDALPVTKPGPMKATDRRLEPARSAYEDGLLFHGPHFQVLEALDDLSGVEGSADLRGTDEVDWGKGPWLTDPAALDGGLQLALLWGLRHKNRKSLPTHFEAFVPLGVPGARARRCDLRVRQSGRHEVVADLLFCEADGRPVAELRGVTMTLLHGSKHVVAN
jgi:malonyl CoA-acyl carrier protein transacylase